MSDYNRMSSYDMAKALEKYGKKCSDGLLEAVAARLIRNADALRNYEAPKPETVTEYVTHPAADAAAKYLLNPTNLHFDKLVYAALPDRSDAKKAAQMRRLRDSAVTMAGIRGCPRINGPECEHGDVFCGHAHEIAIDCWFKALCRVL